MIQKFITVIMFFGLAQYSWGMDCADLSGRYLYQDELEVLVLQKDCAQVTVAHEVGSEKLIVDGIEHRFTDYDGSVVVSKISWSPNRKELIVYKQVIILERPLFTNYEVYSLLPNGDLQMKMVDQFESNQPETRIDVFNRI